MTPIIQSLSDISGRYDALLCDLWGCVHNGKAAFPEAKQALLDFRRAGGAVILLTNAPRPASSVQSQLDGLGVPRDCYDAIATSGEASQLAAARGMVGYEVYHIGAEKDEPFFAEMPRIDGHPPVRRVPLDQAEGIICTGLRDDLTETPDDYRAELLLAKQKGLKLLCTNPDIIVHFGDRQLYCAGAIAELYADMGGESLYFGKPHAPIYELARQKLDQIKMTDRDRILAIGDGIHTDIQGAMAQGIDTLFVTGGIAATTFGPDPAAPDPTLLNNWLVELQMTPIAAIPALH